MSTNFKIFLDDYRHTTIIICVFLLALLLSFYQLSSKSIWYDEALSINFAQQRSHLLLESACLFRPLYFFILRIWTALLGYDEFSSRLLSALFSVVAIWPLYLIGKRITNKQTALLIIFFYAISPYRVIISQQVRNYSLFVLLALLSVYYFIQAVGPRKKKTYVFYYLCTLLFLYTHPYALFLILTQNIYYLWFHRSIPSKVDQWLKCQLLLFVGILPLFAMSQLSSVKSQFGSIPLVQQTIKPLFHTFEAFSYGGPFIGQGGSSYMIPSPLLDVERLLMILFFICAALAVRKMVYQHGSEDRSSVFVVFWAFLPLLLVFSLSFAKPALYQTRYVLISLPPFIILYCIGLTRFSHDAVRRIVIMILCGSMISFLSDYYYGKTPDKFQSWREAAQLIRENIEGGDGLLFFPSEQIAPFWYYYKNSEEKPLQFIGSGRLGQTYFQNDQWRQVFIDTTNLILTVSFHTIYYRTHLEWQRMCHDFLSRHLSKKQKKIWLILSRDWIGRQNAVILIDILKEEYQLISHHNFDFDGIEVLSFQRDPVFAHPDTNKNVLFSEGKRL